MPVEDRPTDDREVTGKHPSRPTADERIKVDPGRSAQQVAAIVDALGGPEVVGVVGERRDDDGGRSEYELAPQDYADMVYMFRRGRILIRDRDLRRVRRALGEVVQGEDRGGINGLTALLVADTTEALATLDRELGTGVGYPDHVVHVTDGYKGSACPATEPFPPESPHRYPERHTHEDCDGTGVFVAFVDTGFDPDLARDTPWLQGVQGDPEFYDKTKLGPYAGHGTFAAGIGRTMAPKIDAYVYGFLPHGGAAFESDLIVGGFARALASAPDILSISAGTYSRGDQGLLGFRVAWEEFGTKGTVVVAAAGNDGWRKPFYPAADFFAVGVGALDRKGNRAYYSNYGSWVDCYALGSEHVNAFPNGRYVYAQDPMTGQWAQFTDGLARWSGTSFATPLVAGVIAARMTWSGESGRLAADSILALARANARRAVGAVVEPWMACRPDWMCGC